MTSRPKPLGQPWIPHPKPLNDEPPNQTKPNQTDEWVAYPVEVRHDIKFADVFKIPASGVGDGESRSRTFGHGRKKPLSRSASFFSTTRMHAANYSRWRVIEERAQREKRNPTRL